MVTINKTYYFLLAMLFIVAVAWGISTNNKTVAEPVETTIKQVRIGGRVIDVDLADTPALQQQGLSGVERLDEGTGMLFVFEETAPRPFWMKDMNFPIDIIWIDENFNIVYIKNNATPESYLEVFTPETHARYVLEVAAGFAVENDIKVGDGVLFTF